MILVFTDLYLPFPGGAERLIFNLARELHRDGQNTVVLTGYHEAQQFDGPPVVTAPIGIWENHAQGAAVLQAFLDEYPVDLIVTHHLYATEFEAEILAAGVPVVQIVLNGRRLPDAAFAVFISEWVRGQLDDRPDDLTLLPPAFDDVVADSHEDAIGFIKPIEHKGVRLVYEIARALPDRRFVILRGEWQDIEIIEELPNVEFLEPVADIRDFYRRVNLLLVPSISEDAGTVAQEATLNGLPCISSYVGGLCETNLGGAFIPERSGVYAWVREIELLDDPGLRAQRVGLQQAGLDAAHQTDRLAVFRRRVRELRA